MEWFTYALLSAIFAGLSHFTLKIAAEKGYNSAQSTYYSMIGAAIISFILFLFNPEIQNFYIILIFAIINSVAYFIASTSRIDSLKHIQTTLFYPIYKIINSTLIFFIGYFAGSKSIHHNTHRIGSTDNIT